MKAVVIKNELGLHARPAARIAELAQQARASIWIVKDDEAIDASSTLDILSLGCAKGTSITLQADDHSDADILSEIAKLAEKGIED